MSNRDISSPLYESAEDSGGSDWETENGSSEDKVILTTPLLPVTTQSSATDRLATFEDEYKYDEITIQLGRVEDILQKRYCPFCRLVITALGGTVPSSSDDGIPTLVELNWVTDGEKQHPLKATNHIPQIRLMQVYFLDEAGNFVTYETQHLFPKITMLANDAPTPLKAFYVRPIKEDLIDFVMVRNWISMCESWHGEHCNTFKFPEHEFTSPVEEIPSFRVVDAINNCLVRPPRDCKYVTLSYVWGTTIFLTALKSNIEELEQPGALLSPQFQEKIPDTIHDAIHVVRELGLQYLWVDSLCIVQDDEGKGKTESIAKMDLVYGCAFLTIIAASGEAATTGLPGVRPYTRGFTQAIEEIRPGFRLAYKTKYQDYIPNAKYYTRAWTFQELHFTKRSLLFIGGQVSYSCNLIEEWREDVVCEDARFVKGHNLPSEERKGNDIGSYEGLIQSYSGLSLTYESDIYNAFAGISRQIQAELSVDLCHGIPDAYFDWFLLWIPISPQKRRNHAPSWSWSGWTGQSWPRIWDWYTKDIEQIEAALRKRTWIIWYQRVAHQSTDCIRVWNSKKHLTSTKPKNFYGGNVKSRFPLNCSQTTPTPRKLIGAPIYYRDILNSKSGPLSGFLQFWTVSVTFKLDIPTSKENNSGPKMPGSRIGFYGRDNRELGILFVDEAWLKDNISKKHHEFILLCEGRDERAKDGREDQEPGWKYMVILIEWQGEWAERVALGSIEKDDLDQTLAPGPVWKEIILA
ncbi:hypothetical protein M422DRAFT_260866 [Sphaerobolus stellatus SS14]|uniref:Heterokaryon incompatibility domain-containing protein n=1 Tax=Sphaerobolus stellatus (strain SS14) TaxID=990650 RepID=A0A0C9VGR3_SPHS4|nr:hypothetical protein M422DRAFT_260866 [Sphaerobolus stellatus SS14]